MTDRVVFDAACARSLAREGVRVVCQHGERNDGTILDDDGPFWMLDPDVPLNARQARAYCEAGGWADAVPTWRPVQKPAHLPAREHAVLPTYHECLDIVYDAFGVPGCHDLRGALRWIRENPGRWRVPERWLVSTDGGETWVSPNGWEDAPFDESRARPNDGGDR